MYLQHTEAAIAARVLKICELLSDCGIVHTGESPKASIIKPRSGRCGAAPNRNGIQLGMIKMRTFRNSRLSTSLHEHFGIGLRTKQVALVRQQVFQGQLPGRGLPGHAPLQRATPKCNIASPTNCSTFNMGTPTPRESEPTPPELTCSTSKTEPQPRLQPANPTNCRGSLPPPPPARADRPRLRLCRIWAIRGIFERCVSRFPRPEPVLLSPCHAMLPSESNTAPWKVETIFASKKRLRPATAESPGGFPQRSSLNKEPA